jgi:hypothetical protein
MLNSYKLCASAPLRENLFMQVNQKNKTATSSAPLRENLFMQVNQRNKNSYKLCAFARYFIYAG